MIAVRTLTTTPVKGMALQHPGRIELNPNGVAENRSYYLIDDSGEMVNGKREGSLVMVRAEHAPGVGRLTLRLPDGTVVSGDASSGTEQVETSFYGRPVAGRVLEGPWSAALSDYVGRPVRLVATVRPGDAVDVHSVTVVSSASLEALRAGAGVSDIDGRRFRMLIEVDGCEAFAEESWIGRTIRIGTAAVRIEGPVPRCVVVTRNPDDGVVDLPVLRMLAVQRGTRSESDLDTSVDHLPDDGKICFGVYGTVERPGVVKVGDEVTTPALLAHPRSS